MGEMEPQFVAEIGVGEAVAIGDAEMLRRTRWRAAALAILAPVIAVAPVKATVTIQDGSWSGWW